MANGCTVPAGIGLSVLAGVYVYEEVVALCLFRLCLSSLFPSFPPSPSLVYGAAVLSCLRLQPQSSLCCCLCVVVMSVCVVHMQHRPHGYVPKDDTMMRTLSVKENLIFSARSRLAPDRSKVRWACAVFD